MFTFNSVRDNWIVFDLFDLFIQTTWVHFDFYKNYSKQSDYVVGYKIL